MVNEFLRFLKSSIVRKGNYLRTHHFPYKQDFERIKPVFAAQMITATRDLLGENGAFRSEEFHRKEGQLSSYASLPLQTGFRADQARIRGSNDNRDARSSR